MSANTQLLLALFYGTLALLSVGLLVRRLVAPPRALLKPAQPAGSPAMPPTSTSSVQTEPLVAHQTAPEPNDAAASRASRFEPAKAKPRDWLLTLLPLAGLFALMRYRGDVINPRGEDPSHPLGHFESLLHSGHIPGGVFIGTILVLLAIVGIFGLLGDSPLDLRGDEHLPAPEERRPLSKREGAWLVGFCVLLYVPLAGAYGLWDPWETHYSEVAREILARDDWITLWWGQEGWFMSKPILIFWMAALGMGAGSTFGLPFWRDMGPASHEWWIRLPIVAFAIGAVYAVYKAVSFAWGRRAGLICGLVLATMPHWFFLSHQAMTDMPFVAPLVVAMSFLMIAVAVDPEKLASPRAVRLFGRTFRVSHWHLAVGAILLVSLPQVMYLLTRPMMIACPEGPEHDACRQVLNASRIGPFQFPIEQYWSGSAGNSVYRDAAASVPGSPAWEERYNQVPFMPSVVQGLVYLGLGTLLMLSYRRERRIQPLAFAMVYLFGAISFMGKGPAGLGVPEIVLLGFMIVTGKWQMLTRIRILQGIAIFAICGFPWYIAIYGRLGNEFFDRFVVHDLLNRAFAGVHGDTGTFRYFVWQLGYALFPWTGFAAAALAGWKLFVPKHASEAQKDTALIALLWVLVTFTLFSLMVTKFHHYIFPMVPGTAILVGLLLHRMLGDRRLAPSAKGAMATFAVVAGVAMLVLGIANFFGAWHGQIPHEPGARLPDGNKLAGIILVGLGAVALVWSGMLARTAEVEHSALEPGVTPLEPEGESAQPLARFDTVSLGAVGLGAAVVLALVARDIGFVGPSRPAGFERFMHLFTYNYERPFPTRSFDYHPILYGFGIVAVGAALLVALRQTRRQGVRMMVALATCFAVWGLDKYMIDLSNHWSQRNLFVRYFQMREPRESTSYGEDARYWATPIMAYQMNWKGENFYTGNHAAMTECGLPLCQTPHNRNARDWLERHRGQRIFVVTEHSRSSSIISQIRQLGGSGHTVTDEYDNNKFVLIEAQL